MSHGTEECLRETIVVGSPCLLSSPRRDFTAAMSRLDIFGVGWRANVSALIRWENFGYVLDSYISTDLKINTLRGMMNCPLKSRSLITKSYSLF